jgi:hypothetical protein
MQGDPLVSKEEAPDSARTAASKIPRQFGGSAAGRGARREIARQTYHEAASDSDMNSLKRRTSVFGAALIHQPIQFVTFRHRPATILRETFRVRDFSPFPYYD